MNIDILNKIDSVAVIRIHDGIVHLVATFNPDASCCQEDETGETLQLETYDPENWVEPKDNPRLAAEFWSVWTEWNGRVCGGIELDDEFSYGDAEKMISPMECISTEEIATAADGTYCVIADQER